MNYNALLLLDKHHKQKKDYSSSVLNIHQYALNKEKYNKYINIRTKNKQKFHSTEKYYSVKPSIYTIPKDINLKEGTVLQTLSANKDRLDSKDDSNYFYAAFNKRDKETYKAVWGKPVNMFGMTVGDNKYNIGSKIAKNTKVASQKSGMEIFKKLAESDEDFAKHIGYSPEMTKRLSKKGLNTYIKQRYMKFDYDLADHENSKITGKFFKALKDAGYSGIVDSNDLKGAGGKGLKTKAPIIMFDHSSYVSDTIKQLSDMDINKAQASRQAKQATEAMLQMIIPYAGASAAATATGVAVNYDKNVIDKYKKNKETSK